LSLTTLVWEWDYHREVGKLRTLYSLGEALVFLSSDAIVQKNSVCGCPFCEVWNDQCSDVLKFIDNVGDLASPELSSILSQLSVAFDNLSGKECECNALDIFEYEGWGKIRELSAIALEKLEWVLLERYRCDLENL
jgi:hypothetical protein